MPATARQIDANRANSKRSTGPRTPSGKEITRLNSVTHGLASQTISRRPDQAEAFTAFSASLLERLAPADGFELDLARRIVHDAWRLNRAAAFDENILAEAAWLNSRRNKMPTGDNYDEEFALDDAAAYRIEAATFNLLTLYEQRIQRKYERNLALLKAAQQERLAAACPKAPQPSAKPASRPAVRPAQYRENPAPASAIGFARSTAPAAPASPSTVPASPPTGPASPGNEASVRPENMAA